MRSFPASSAWLLLTLAVPFACATSVGMAPSDEGEGGSGATTTTTTGGGGAGVGGSASGGAGGATTAIDAGPRDAAPDGPPVSCAGPVDCVGLSDACNQGACVNGVCVREPANDFGACDDGAWCSENDSCQNGACVAGNQRGCPGGDSCHVGVCDEGAKQCTVVAGNDGAGCDDGDSCTLQGFCSAGSCEKGPGVDCSVLDGTCVLGVCDPKVGCVQKPAKDGAFCDDGLFCTESDACKAGACSGTAKTCVAKGDLCKVGSCDEATDSCVAVAGNEGGKCDDGNTCTSGETCASGTCAGGKAANEGAACDDKNACSTGTVCQAGACAGGAPVLVCKSGDGCCPKGCDAKADDDCGGIVYLTSSNGTAGFYAYDVVTDTWATLASPPAVTYSQITTDGANVLLLGQDSVVYAYDPVAKSWTKRQDGPGPISSSPIGFFKWTPKGLYYVKDGTTMLMYSQNAGPWQNLNLPVAPSSAGTFDAASQRLYLRSYGNLGLIVFDVATNSVVQSWPNPAGCGENSRTGSYFGGFFYTRDWSAPFQKMDVATGAVTATNIMPSEGHTSSDVDPVSGDLFVGPYTPTGTTFQVYRTATNTLVTLAPAPVAVTNHSTIVLVK